MQSTTLMTGFATFSMFFGAGNVVFPLDIGQTSQSQTFFAISGLLITSVGIPLMGLVSMTLFHGDYQTFFQRIGKTPGYFFSLFIMLIIGPFGASPRTVALSYATILHFYPITSLPMFSFFSCLLIFVLAYNRGNIVDVLGKFLTPFLLISLLIMILVGLIKAQKTLLPGFESPLPTFVYGLKEGYQTMDLLAAPFFASVIIACLENYLPSSERGRFSRSEPTSKSNKKLIHLTLRACFFAAFLLAGIYVGFSYLAAYYSQELAGVKPEELIASIAKSILGKYGGIVASIAVALACLTTAIALSSVFAEFIHKDVSGYAVSYGTALFFTMIITFFISTLNFSGIVKMLSPVLQILYPVLIVLSFVNMLHKLYRFQPVKWPVYATLGLSLFFYFR